MDRFFLSNEEPSDSLNRLAISSIENVYKNVSVVARESMKDSSRERLVLLCFRVATLFWFAGFKGKQTLDKILSPLFVVVNRSYIRTFMILSVDTNIGLANK